MTKNEGSSRIRLVFILFASAVFIPQPLLASEEMDTLAKSMIQESVAAVACDDKRLIGLSGLNYDSCLAKSESVAPRCWEGMQPLIPDLRFGKNDFAGEENQEIIVSTLFVLEKCIQASILMSSDGNNGTQINELGGSSKRMDGPSGVREKGPESHVTWAEFFETTRADFTGNRDLASQISNALTAYDLFLVTLDSRKNVLAFRRGKDETLTPVSDNLQSWSEMLANANVRSASRTDAGVVLSIGSEMTTDSHRLGVSYISANEPSLPQCTPDLRQIQCGSCEIDRSDDHRLIVTWYSREIKISQFRDKLDGDNIDLNDHKSLAMLCWMDGMSQLGFDADPF